MQLNEKTDSHNLNYSYSELESENVKQVKQVSSPVSYDKSVKSQLQFQPLSTLSEETNYFNEQNVKIQRD